MSELGFLLDGSSGTRETIKDSANVGTWLHGDDSELVLLIDPHKEGLVVVVEDSSASWPVTVETTCLQETVTLLEQEMVSDELFAILGRKFIKRIEFAGKVTFELIACFNNQVHDFVSLVLGNTWSKWVCSEVAANSDPGRFDHSSLIFWKRWGVEAGGIHVGDVLGIDVVAVVVLLNDWVENLVELLV